MLRAVWLQLRRRPAPLPGGGDAPSGDDVRPDELLAAARHGVRGVHDGRRRRAGEHAPRSHQHGLPGLHAGERTRRRRRQLRRTGEMPAQRRRRTGGGGAGSGFGMRPVSVFLMF